MHLYEALRCNPQIIFKSFHCCHWIHNNMSQGFCKELIYMYVIFNISWGCAFCCWYEKPWIQAVLSWITAGHVIVHAWSHLVTSIINSRFWTLFGCTNNSRQCYKWWSEEHQSKSHYLEISRRIQHQGSRVLVINAGSYIYHLVAAVKVEISIRAIIWDNMVWGCATYWYLVILRY